MQTYLPSERKPPSERHTHAHLLTRGNRKQEVHTTYCNRAQHAHDPAHKQYAQSSYRYTYKYNNATEAPNHHTTSHKRHSRHAVPSTSKRKETSHARTHGTHARTARTHTHTHTRTHTRTHARTHANITSTTPHPTTHPREQQTRHGGHAHWPTHTAQTDNVALCTPAPLHARGSKQGTLHASSRCEGCWFIGTTGREKNAQVSGRLEYSTFLGGFGCY